MLFECKYSSASTISAAFTHEGTLKNDRTKGYIKLGLLFGHLVVFELFNETEQVAVKVIIKHKIEKFFILKRKT